MTNQEYNRTETRNVHWQHVPSGVERQGEYAQTNIEDDFKFKYLPVHHALNACVPYVKTDSLTLNKLIEINAREQLTGLVIPQTEARNIEVAN